MVQLLLFTIIALLAAVLAILAIAAAALRRIRGGELSALALRFGSFERDQARIERSVRDELARNRHESATGARALREEVTQSVSGMQSSVLQGVGEISEVQKHQLEGLNRQLATLTDSNERRLEMLRESVQTQLKALQDDNATRLEQMRHTVDEKLQGTLEARLGDSFRLVSERLEQVHKGLGEMQALASGVGDLKKVLSNVKTRGTWGEVQLQTLLDQVLAPSQYERNVATREGSLERVEFAIKLPGRDGLDGPCVWLPIDAKFPQEDYQRLTDAADRGDADGLDTTGRQLEARLKLSARQICEKYVNPPVTTDFAILFLPTEGLYAEVLRRPGLVDSLQHDCRVTVAGPTTLWAILNSLQMGFRTLAIERRSSEVWGVLANVKAEFAKFSGLIDGVQKKLQEASNKMDAVSRKSRTIQRRLRDVQHLSPADAEFTLEPPPSELDAIDEREEIEEAL